MPPPGGIFFWGKEAFIQPFVNPDLTRLAFVQFRVAFGFQC